MPRHFLHRRKDSRVADSAGLDLRGDHLSPAGSEQLVAVGALRLGRFFGGPGGARQTAEEKQRPTPEHPIGHRAIVTPDALIAYG